MKVLITGSNGFLGHNIQNELRQIIPSAKPSKLARSKSQKSDEYSIDFNNLDSLIRCTALQKADVVVHLAGVTKGITENDFRSVNVVATRNLLEAIRRTNSKIERFVYISSHTAAGPSRSYDHHRSEDEEPTPVELYGRSKLEAETIVQSYGYGIPYTILRPGAVYSAYGADFLNVFKMTRFKLNIYPGYKHNFVSYIYALDAIYAIGKAILNEREQNQTYFIFNDMPASWQEIYELIFKIAGSSALSLDLPAGLLRGISYLSILPSVLSNTVPILHPQKMILSVQ